MFAFSELLRRIHAEAVGPSARPTWEMCPSRGFYSLTYRVRPYSSEQPRPSYAGRTTPCGDVSMWTGILCRTWQTIVYKGARSGGQNGNPSHQHTEEAK